MLDLAFGDLGKETVDSVERPARRWHSRLEEALLLTLESKRAAWAVLSLLLATGLPLMLCMPVCPDVTLYDLAARNLLEGGVHYRDVFDTNLPGMVWSHVAIRALLGWRFEALRLVDLLIVSATIWLLVSFLPGLRRPRAAGIWGAAVLYAFYFSTPEWCHCQRDTWMLLPALAALGLRLRALSAGTDPKEASTWTKLRPVCEGLCWGAAFWIKPFVAVPALTCWLLTAVLLAGQRRRLVRASTGLLLGGLMALAMGTAWLYLSGAWPYFWDIMRHWNLEYNHRATPLYRRLYILCTWLSPWSLAHLLAVPIAGRAVVRGIGRVTAQAADASTAKVPQVLLATFYLGWLLQVVLLQKWYYYIQTPVLLLALALVLEWGWSWRRSLIPAGIVTSLILAALMRYYLFRIDQRSLWLRCLIEGSTPALRDDLNSSVHSDIPSWQELEEVANFLKGQGVRDGEVTCYNNSTHPLYLDLHLKPSTRFLHFDTVLQEFPSHRQEVRCALAASRQRYVVSDLRTLGLLNTESLSRPLKLPAAFPKRWAKIYPWTYPVVYNTGRYLVHRVNGPMGEIWPERPPTPAEGGGTDKLALPVRARTAAAGAR